MTDPAIPVIDLTPFYGTDEGARAALARAADEACRSVGFLVVTGHRVDPALVEGLRAAALAFFALPLEEKMVVKMPPDAYRGYAYVGSESLAASYDDGDAPDIKESFTTGPIRRPAEPYASAPGSANFFATNLWPARVPGLQALWEAYYDAMSELARDLMRLFALALGLEERWFDGLVDRHITNMSAIHYPPLDGPPGPGQLRGGAHTDFGSLTILQRDEAPGGLQVRVGGSWVDAPHVADSFTVNLGDLMAEWTNDRWVSTVHRVVPPPDVGDAASDRLSIPFFHQPNYDAVIETIPTCVSAERPAMYRAITSGAHILGKIARMRSPELGLIEA